MQQNFDTAAFFDEDYFYFTGGSFDDDTNEREVQLIWQLLDLQPDMHILDLGCGYGRISNLLAKMQCHVVGLDNNNKFLDIARAEAQSLKTDAVYQYGDMRSLEWENQFDRVIMWFSTFGYFADTENHAVLAGTLRSLKTGGQLLLDLMNRDGVISTLPRDFVMEREENLEIHRHQYDPLTGRVNAERIVVREGHIRRASYFIRLFTFTEIRDWLLNAGFSHVEAFGSDRCPFSIRSDRMLVRASK